MFETKKDLKTMLEGKNFDIKNLKSELRKFKQRRDDEVRELKNQLADMKDSAERNEANLLLDIKLKSAKMEIDFKNNQIDVKNAWNAKDVELVRKQAVGLQTMQAIFNKEKDNMLKIFLGKLPDFDIKFDCKTPNVTINNARKES